MDREENGSGRGMSLYTIAVVKGRQRYKALTLAEGDGQRGMVLLFVFRELVKALQRFTRVLDNDSIHARPLIPAVVTRP